jgi:hypothetical protein
LALSNIYTKYPLVPPAINATTSNIVENSIINTYNTLNTTRPVNYLSNFGDYSSTHFNNISFANWKQLLSTANEELNISNDVYTHIDTVFYMRYFFNDINNNTTDTTTGTSSYPNSHFAFTQIEETGVDPRSYSQFYFTIQINIRNINSNTKM